MPKPPASARNPDRGQRILPMTRTIWLLIAPGAFDTGVDEWTVFTQASEDIMDTRFLAQIKKRLPWIAAAAALGGIGFLVGQVLGGFPVHIAKFMGSQIVRQGGYNESLA